jgi:hypothetical protein
VSTADPWRSAATFTLLVRVVDRPHARHEAGHDATV